MKKGSHHTLESRARMSAAKWDKKLSLEHRAKISAGRKGKCCGDDHPMKRPEVAAKVSIALIELGDNHPMKRPEARARQAAAWRGTNNPMKRPEVAAKMAAAKRGKKRPDITGDRHFMKRPEVKAKHTTVMKRPEVRAKISAAQRGDKNAMKRPEVAAKLRGDKNGNWQGGTGREPYAWTFNEELKEEIRRRDGYYCQRCGKTQAENGQKLSIHHIDYNKKNSDPMNLITLCNGCNGRVNTNRPYWTEYFSGLNRELVA